MFLIPSGFVSGTGPSLRALRERVLLRAHFMGAFRLPSETDEGKSLFPGRCWSRMWSFCAVAVAPSPPFPTQINTFWKDAISPSRPSMCWAARSVGETMTSRDAHPVGATKFAAPSKGCLRWRNAISAETAQSRRSDDRRSGSASSCRNTRSTRWRWPVAPPHIWS